MKKNLGRNEDLSERIRIIPVPLSDSNRTIEFNYSDKVDNETSSGGYISGSHPPLSFDTYRGARFQKSEIKSRKLDDIVGDNEYQSIALLKVDVEGAEHLVIRGATNIIKASKPIIMVEVHSVASMLELACDLTMMGYDLEPIEISSSNRCFVARHSAGFPNGFLGQNAHQSLGGRCCPAIIHPAFRLWLVDYPWLFR